MYLTILSVIFTFIFYFLTCFNTLDLDHKYLFALFFLIGTIIIRVQIDVTLNKDYYGYYDHFNFDSRTNMIELFFSEPYLYFLFKFFEIFTNDKSAIFNLIYWFTFLLVNMFYIWLAFRKDVQMWKKMLLFVFYYFLFGFVLLRNGPAYLLFGLYFYYSYRGIKFNEVLLTPFIHISSLAMLITFFHKNKYYFRFFLITIIVVSLTILVLMPLLSEMLVLQNSISKADSYSVEVEVVSVFHKIYFLFITVVFLFSCYTYKNKIINPIILTTFILYYVGFMINPVVGFRFTPYIFFAILFFNFDGSFNNQFTKVLNLISFFLFPYFIYTLLDTHYL
jgi:hypothetical protein